ncbi:hypothetical protein GCM10023187_51570 [Nibrella viscosa]|uniref:Uncharacterized protein n=1 Tax=Nibrella viscosa TaxID=1084524 RepID=A0ABP8KWR8_9BACT
MKTEKYQQIRLMAQMSGKSFLELKTHYDCKETIDTTTAYPVRTYVKISTSVPKTSVPA